MGRVLFGGGKVEMKAPSNGIGDPVFANNDWATIIEACKSNRVHDTWAIGDQKLLYIGGDEYLIDIIGKYHDDYADGSGKAPLTFQMHDCYEGDFDNGDGTFNYGGWASSGIRQSNLPAHLNTMPTEVKEGIAEVKKISSVGGASTQLQETTDKLFLLSESEVLGTAVLSVPGEGAQYEYYAAGNTSIKKKKSGTYGPWWTRSANPASSRSFIAIPSHTEHSSESQSCMILNLLSYAFCF